MNDHQMAIGNALDVQEFLTSTVPKQVSPFKTGPWRWISG